MQDFVHQQYVSRSRKIHSTNIFRQRKASTPNPKSCLSRRLSLSSAHSTMELMWSTATSSSLARSSQLPNPALYSKSYSNPLNSLNPKPQNPHRTLTATLTIPNTYFQKSEPRLPTRPTPLHTPRSPSELPQSPHGAQGSAGIGLLLLPLWL